MQAHTVDDLRRMGSPLRRTKVCGGVCAALVAALVFATLVHLTLIVALPSDVAGVFFGALALSTLFSVPPVVLLWILDRSERKTPGLFADAFLWGGCIATAFALPFNTALLAVVDHWVAHHPATLQLLGPDAPLLLAAPIFAPIAEEIFKATGVLVIFWLLRGESNGLRDGIVYGALVGAGFNWFESALYVAQGYIESGQAPFALQLGARYALFGFGGHAMLTAIFGAFLGLGLQAPQRWLRIAAPIFGLLLSMFAHMVHNALPLFAAVASAVAGNPPPEREPLPDVGFWQAFLSGSLVELAIFLPFLLIAAVALWRIGIWERRVAREELAGEVGRTVTPSEYRDIVADGVLRTRRIDPLMPRRSAALVNAQHELALRKRRARDRGHAVDADRHVAAWRDEIERLRRFLPAAGERDAHVRSPEVGDEM